MDLFVRPSLLFWRRCRRNYIVECVNERRPGGNTPHRSARHPVVPAGYLTAGLHPEPRAARDHLRIHGHVARSERSAGVVRSAVGITIPGARDVGGRGQLDGADDPGTRRSFRSRAAPILWPGMLIPTSRTLSRPNCSARDARRPARVACEGSQRAVRRRQQ